MEIINKNLPIRVSVIMSTYNTELSMLTEAVDSILRQTLRDFEFIIVDDGSTNGTDAYLKSIRDERVTILRNERNLGLTKSLNIALKLAKGTYIARMDADDVSFPTRLEAEYAYMEAHPNTVACGMNNIPSRRNRADTMAYYRVKMLFMNPGPLHGSAMIRHETLLAHHILYDERLIHSQDYGLWKVLCQYGEIHLTEEPLIFRRKHAMQITVYNKAVQMACDRITQKSILTELLGSVTDSEVELHYYHSCGRCPDAVISPEIAGWYDRLIRANRERGIYDQKLLEQYIITLKKNLIRQTFTPDMPLSQKLRMIFRYLPPLSGARMALGLIRRPG